MKPELVAQVRYTEVTDDGRLRHPAYLGLRDDKVAKDVTTPVKAPPSPAPKRSNKTATAASKPSKAAAKPARKKRAGAMRSRRGLWRPIASPRRWTISSRRKKDGKITLPDGDTLDVTNLHKVFWPEAK